MSLLPSPKTTNVILRVPGSPDIQLGVETIHFYAHGNSLDEKKWKKILIERFLLNPDDNIIINMNHLTEQKSHIIITRVSDSAGGLENNGSGFTGLPNLPKPPKIYREKDKEYWENEYAKVKKVYNDLPKGRGRIVLSERRERNKQISKLKEIQAKINSFPLKASPNLIQFPTLQNNLSGLFSGPAGAGGGAPARSRKLMQRKTQKRKSRRNRTRKN